MNKISFSHSVKAILALLVLGLMVKVSLNAFPFWLDQPSRANPFDPKSTMFHPITTPLPTRTPMATWTPYAGSPTATFTPTTTPIATSTPTPNGLTFVVFEDFSGGTIVNDSTWAGGSDLLYSSLNTTTTYAGAGASNALTITVGTPTGYNAVGHNFSSHYGIINAAGAVNMVAYVLSTQSCTMVLRFFEGNTFGADGECWNGPSVNVVGSPTWQKISVPISSFTQHISGCNCPLLSGIMNLQSVYKVEIEFDSPPVLTLATVYMDKIGFEVNSALPTPTPVATPNLTPTMVVFEDFSSGVIVDDSLWWNTSSTDIITSTVTNAVACPGSSYSNALTVTVGTPGSWGSVGHNFESHYGLVIQAPGAVSMTAMVMTNQALTMKIKYFEAYAYYDDASCWCSPAISVPANPGVWQQISAPISAFTMITGNCCNGTGSVMNPSAVNKVEIEFDGSNTAANVYMGDIGFTR